MLECLKNLQFDIAFDIVGLLGFVLSLFNMCYILLCNRKKTDISITDIRIANLIPEYSTVFILFKFVNQSHLPISITRIEMSYEEQVCYDCDSAKCIVSKDTTKSNGKEIDGISVYTEILPITLDCLAAHSCYLAYQVPRDKRPNLDTLLTFQIFSNRGKSYRMTSVLSDCQKCPISHKSDT